MELLEELETSSCDILFSFRTSCVLICV